MAVSVSDAVYQEVQGKVADHQASVNLIQNQMNVAQQSLAEWNAILADLAQPAAPEVVAQAPVASQPLG